MQLVVSGSCWEIMFECEIYCHPGVDGMIPIKCSLSKKLEVQEFEWILCEAENTFPVPKYRLKWCMSWRIHDVQYFTCEDLLCYRHVLLSFPYPPGLLRNYWINSMFEYGPYQTDKNGQHDHDKTNQSVFILHTVYCASTPFYALKQS